MFTPNDVRERFKADDEKFFARYTGLVEQCVERELKDPDTYITWRVEKRLSIPLRLDEKGEEELFKGFTFRSKKRMLEFLSRKLEKEFETMGWEARVSPVWLELRPRRRNKGKKKTSTNVRDFPSVTDGSKG